jgi:transcriptional regulator of acetoin/glycerol metabolism
VIERVMSYARSNALTFDLIPGEITRTKTMPGPIGDMESPQEKEKKLIIKMMELNFDKIMIAEKLNVSRATLYRKIRKHGLSLKK